VLATAKSTVVTALLRFAVYEALGYGECLEGNEQCQRKPLGKKKEDC